MKQFNITHILITVLFFIVFGCENSSESGNDIVKNDEQFIQISEEQFKSNNMEISELTNQSFEDEIVCNGYITAPPNGMAQISTQISGIVKKINFSLGNYVRKGQVLSMLSSNEFIVLQQDFAESSAMLKGLKADFERSKSLYEENVGAKKDFINTESKYKAMKAKYRSLKLQLELLNLNTSKIKEGELYAAFPIIAPINGYITSQNIVLGQFVEQQTNIMEIVNTQLLQLQLSVFENDINKLKEGQIVKFNTMEETGMVQYASISSVGKTINRESKTIECIAKIKRANNVNYTNRSYIEAQIVINKREAKAIPNDAILKSDEDYYVFVLSKLENKVYYLKKQAVTIGSKSKKYTEIIGDENLTKILTKGAYNLQTE